MTVPLIVTLAPSPKTALPVSVAPASTVSTLLTLVFVSSAPLRIWVCFVMPLANVTVPAVTLTIPVLMTFSVARSASAKASLPTMAVPPVTGTTVPSSYAAQAGLT